MKTVFFFKDGKTKFDRMVTEMDILLSSPSRVEMAEEPEDGATEII